MKKTVSLLLLLSLVVFVHSTFADGKLLRGEKWQQYSNESTNADFYVSPDGNDNWSGTLAEPNSAKTDGPFATLHRAQQAVRELKAYVYKPKDPPVETRWIGSPHELGSGKDVLVLIRDGYYSLSSPLIFTPFDGGERVETNLPTGAFEYHKLKDHYVTYAAYPGEKPVISGGKKINGWKQEKNYWVTDFENGPIEKLVVKGDMQTLARTPNNGYFTPPKISPSKLELCFSPDQLQDWPDKEGNRIYMLLRWHRGVNTIAKIDETKGIATFAKPQNGVDVVPPRFYVENVKSLMDAPGEWYLDESTGKLYFIPPVSVTNPNKTLVVNTDLADLIKITGTEDSPVRNLRFYGLTFEATKSGGAAVSLEYAHACEVVDSDMKSMGGTGIRVSKGCYQTKILENSFKTIDASAIAVNGNPHPEDWADIIRETVISFNRAEDCDGTSIYAYNTLFTTISRNEITDNRGRYCISVGGWSNLEEAIDGGYRVEFNHCFNVQKLADDSGVIKTAGLTHDSIVRGNLIHDVKAGYFNDNVGFWFDNMSSGWLSEENIYYDLQQGEMKLCAANLVDNIYQNNFIIESPDIAPEPIILGDPVFEYGDLTIVTLDGGDNSFVVGDYIKVSAEIRNTGSSGLLPVHLIHNGRMSETQLFPVIKNNKRLIEFELRLDKPGKHRFSIGSSDEKSINVNGTELQMVVENFIVNQRIVATGESINCTATVTNRAQSSALTVPFLVDDQEIGHKELTLAQNESEQIAFSFEPTEGKHRVQIGNSKIETVAAFAHKFIDVKNVELKTHISGTARGSKIDIDKQNNKFKITATGTDFYHAEDSYAAVFMENVTGNFVATVKATAFGHRTHEWFRAGLFARNEIDKSFDTEPGSKGSVLMFTTPGRAGIEWDEFGDGCMHKAASENLPEDIASPVWIKLVRRGNSFSGYISLDGENWIIEQHTNDLPGIQKSIDVGLAAGSCDEKPYWVEFVDFTLQVEE